MKNRLYTYYPVIDERECIYWIIHENATDQAITTFYFEDDAVEEMNRLENGGGFAGFTPSFVLQKVNIPINEAFAAEFA